MSSSVTAPSLEEKFANITVWKSGGQRAPHKPLLVLLGLGALQRREPRLMAFADVEPKLRSLLEGFGGPRTRANANYPFWRLEADGIWNVEGLDIGAVRERNREPGRQELLDRGVRAGFAPPIYEALQSDPDMIPRLAHVILDAHFPVSLHEDILAEAAIDVSRARVGSTRSQRDPTFRGRILRAYQYRCAVCGYAGRLNRIPVGLEGAHIKWLQADGPDVETNGLSLCSLHHRLFDRGVFTVTHSLQIRVSEHFDGGEVGGGLMTLFDEGELLKPRSADFHPASEYLEWHHLEVYRGVLDGAA